MSNTFYLNIYKITPQQNIYQFLLMSRKKGHNSYLRQSNERSNRPIEKHTFIQITTYVSKTKNNLGNYQLYRSSKGFS